jgi:hypothetical protein
MHIGINMYERMHVVWRMYADDPAGEKAHQLDIQAFHDALPASLAEGLALVFDFHCYAVLYSRRERLAEVGREEPAWPLWGHYGEDTLKGLLVNTTVTFGDSQVLMNHPQGLQNFPRLRYS